MAVEYPTRRHKDALFMASSSENARNAKVVETDKQRAAGKPPDDSAELRRIPDRPNGARGASFEAVRVDRGWGRRGARRRLLLMPIVGKKSMRLLRRTPQG